MIIAESSHLILRTWQPGDAPDAFEIYRDPEVSKLIGDGRPVETVDKVEIRLKKFNTHQLEFGFSPWAVVDKVQRVIGICGLHTFNDNSEPELGFRILRSCWGQGMATEASRLALSYGFEKLALSCISAVTHPENFATKKILLKLGFNHTGSETIKSCRYDRYEIRSI